MEKIDPSENKRRMLAGELYVAFTPDLIAERVRCTKAVNRFNDTRETSRRHRVQLWRDPRGIFMRNSIVGDERPLPPTAATSEQDDSQFDTTDPWVEPPIHIDYGTQVRIAPGAFVNFNATFVDTLPINIGARTLVGPNCSFYSGAHPLNPDVRNGLEGPESGKEISIGEDCWLGGNVTILPGVKIGKGSVCGAGAVVTKDVPPLHVVAGNPARVIRKLATEAEVQKETTPAWRNYHMRTTDFAL